MGIFRKKVDDSSSDQTLTFMSVAAAGRLRAEMAVAFAEQGLETQVFNDHLVDADGRQFGVYNLGAACFNDERGEGAWPGIIRDHVTRILAGMDAPSALETMTDDELRGSIYPRLYERSGLPAGHVPDYGTEFLGDVVEVFNLDLPDTVQLLDDSDVERLGGRAALRPHAIRNLLGVLPTLTTERLSNGEAHLDVLLGESMFTASTVLVMPELLAQLGIGETPHGVLVAMPFRSQVVIHVIRDAAVIPSLNALVGFAATGFSEGSGPLSPHTYWWHQGSFEQLTALDDEGVLTVDVGPGLETVLADLVG